MRIAIDGADGRAAAGVANVKWDCRRVAIIGVLVVVAGACVHRAPVVDEATAPPADATSPSPVAGAPADADAAPAVASRSEPLRKPRAVPDGKNAFPSAWAACDWLARHQSADGGWRLRSPGGGCGDARCSMGEGPPDFVGDTSLALLAFLSADVDLDSTPDRAAFRSGLSCLVSAQAPDGSFDAASAPHRVLDQALATEALCWALAERTHERGANRLLRAAAERALAHLLVLRTPGAAWSDATLGSTCDLRVTTWATMAIAQARHADIEVSTDVSRDVLAWLDADRGGRSEAAAAMRTCCRVLLGATQRDPHLIADHEILVAFDADENKEGTATDALGRYFVTVAESVWGGEVWARRFGSRNGAVIPLQHREGDGCVCGSWDPDGAVGPEGDRVGVTALTAMLFDAGFISTYANVMRAREPQIPK